MSYNVSEKLLALNMIFILYYLLHMKMKKMLVGAFLGMFTLAGVAVLPNYASAQSDTSNFEGEGAFTQQDTKYNPNTPGSDSLKNDSLIHVIKRAINWVLGILSLIALALCLYAGFLMMTSGGDSKKYEKGVGILKWAGIGLAIIALSWLIVSLIFWIIEWSIWDAGGDAGSQGEVTP